MKRTPFLLFVVALYACNSERAAIDSQADASAPDDGSTAALDGSSAADAGQGGGTDDIAEDANTGVEEDAADAAAPETDLVEDTVEPDVAVEDAEAPEVDAATGPDTAVEEDIAAVDVQPDIAADVVVEPDAGDDGAEPWPTDPTVVPEAAELFPLSVQAGAMRAASALLWTFVADAQPVELRVWREGDGGERLLAYEATVASDAAGYLHAPVEGLRAGTWYRYAFFRVNEAGELQQRSPIGRFSTAWAPGVRAPLTVASTSCTNQRFRPLDAVERMAERDDISLFLHTGDQHYNDGYETLEEFRNGWRSQLAEQAYRRMHETVGFYQTWDDHEVDNDYDPTSIASSILRAAVQSYDESFAIERGPEGGIWTYYVWGDTAEFIILDSRSERFVPDDSYYMSQAQLDWFLD
ncbi:MAG: alkaline phosphatase D family protein, partial [Myxococcales bacterium]|nr:alkaline phosphatase D family protein [Myxococcales bacterium]